jgi:hypothetical protein
MHVRSKGAMDILEEQNDRDILDSHKNGGNHDVIFLNESDPKG